MIACVAPQPAQMRPTDSSVRVLICVEDVTIRELMSTVLEEEGYTVTSTDVATWLVGNQPVEPLPAAMILDAWPLRLSQAAYRAHERISAQGVPIVLLIEQPHQAHLVDSLGAIAALPLGFTVHDLITVVQHAANHKMRARASSTPRV